MHLIISGYDENHREYPVLAGFDNWKKLLKKHFPSEEKGIDKFFELLDEYNGNTMFGIMMKVLPLWVSKIVCTTPLLRFFTNLWSGEKDKTTLEIVQSLTDDKDLQTAMTYCWGDFGTVPEKSHFSMMSLLHQHYRYGAFYPGRLNFNSQACRSLIFNLSQTNCQIRISKRVFSKNQFFFHQNQFI